jgi:hypothetical protein
MRRGYHASGFHIFKIVQLSRPVAIVIAASTRMTPVHYRAVMSLQKDCGLSVIVCDPAVAQIVEASGLEIYVNNSSVAIVTRRHPITRWARLYTTGWPANMYAIYPDAFCVISLPLVTAFFRCFSFPRGF